MYHDASMTDADFLHEEPPAYGGGGKPAPLTEYLRILERALNLLIGFLSQKPVDIASWRSS
jgi:hypothetical protein